MLAAVLGVVHDEHARHADGRTQGDIEGFAVGSAGSGGSLRAERSGRGGGRTYRLTWVGEDEAGNTASCIATVKVPRSAAR